MSALNVLTHRDLLTVADVARDDERRKLIVAVNTPVMRRDIDALLERGGDGADVLNLIADALREGGQDER